MIGEGQNGSTETGMFISGVKALGRTDFTEKGEKEGKSCKTGALEGVGQRVGGVEAESESAWNNAAHPPLEFGPHSDEALEGP